jgi:hypothetical protein
MELESVFLSLKWTMSLSFDFVHGLSRDGPPSVGEPSQSFNPNPQMDLYDMQLPVDTSTGLSRDGPPSVGDSSQSFNLNLPMDLYDTQLPLNTSTM